MMKATYPPASPWLRIGKPNSQAEVRLFCFPYAGGSASIYRLWSQYLPPEIEVCAVQLPGRENRIREQPFTNTHDLLQRLLPALLPWLDKPFVLFGHSMGAIIAYELTQELRRQNRPLPRHLLVSGRRAPTLPDPEPPIHALPSDGAFLHEMQRRYNNLPAMLFENAELRNLFVPLLRADLTLVETYQNSERTALPCPIVAFGGDKDPGVTKAELSRWREVTDGNFALHILPGGHFFLNDQMQQLLAHVGKLLNQPETLRLK